MDEIQSMCELIGIPQEGIDILKQMKEENGSTVEEVCTVVAKAMDFAKVFILGLQAVLGAIKEIARHVAQMVKKAEERERSRKYNGQRRPFRSHPSNIFRRIRPTARSTL